MKQKDFNQKFVSLISKPNALVADELSGHLKNSPKLSASRALEVYQEDYQARLCEALKNTYRSIYFILGDEEFNQLASDYIANYSSVSSDLDDYGNHLEFFIATHILGNEYPFLAELANFEWNFRDTFHTRQPRGLSAEELSQLLQEENQLVTLVPGLKLLKYNFLISSLYALKDQPDNEQEKFDIHQEDYSLMIKTHSVVKTYRLSTYQWDILLEFYNKNNSLFRVLENLNKQIQPEEVQALFKILGANQLLMHSS